MRDGDARLAATFGRSKPARYEPRENLNPDSAETEGISPTARAGTGCAQVPAQMWAGVSPSPGADVAGVSPVLGQMWQG